MGSVFTVSQLLALRPHGRQVSGPFKPEHASLAGTYFSLWRRYQLDLARGPDMRGEPAPQVVWKYDITTSNKKFKKRWVQTHGTTLGLSQIKRKEVHVRSVRVVVLENHIRSLQKLLSAIDRLRVKLTSLISSEPVWPGRVPASAPGNFRTGKTHAAPSTKKYQRGLAAKVQAVGPDNYLRVIGGLTYSIKSTSKPPPKGRDKYWYFYRKNRRWHASEHHPYGDEPYYAVIA